MGPFNGSATVSSLPWSSPSVPRARWGDYYTPQLPTLRMGFMVQAAAVPIACSARLVSWVQPRLE